MNDFLKYLSTAPVLLTLWMTFTAGFIIEINRFFSGYVGFVFLTKNKQTKSLFVFICYFK
jgi:photosystem I subunit 9